VLYRLFPFRPGVVRTEEGGVLHVAAALQGGGRHDNPDLYVAYYASRSVVSAVAEHLKGYIRLTLTDRDLLTEYGLPYAVASLDDARLPDLVDLDDPRVLLERALRPSRVGTRSRRTTQGIARAIYEGRASGFEWWSTIEASWTNVTLFADRALDALTVTAEPEPLTVMHPAVREAAEVVGVELA
jgi:hypothetical protein